MLSLAVIVLSFFSIPWLSLISALPFLYGIYLMVAAFTQKEKIKFNSIFSSIRRYKRLTSDGNIVTEAKINIITRIFWIGSIVTILLGSFSIVSIFIKDDLDLTLKIITISLMAFDTIFFYPVLMRFSSEHLSPDYGKYLYYYKGEYYESNK